MSIYVETFVRSSLAELWAKTQCPQQHAQWDLRFSQIDYKPRVGAMNVQPFDYRTRIGFGVAVTGQGESLSTCEDRRGRRTSSLKFWSSDRKSLIRNGAGYWQFEPAEYGVRFITSYDYRTNGGAAGRMFDRIVFRPLMAWATAWSFDRLRMWIERGVPPRTALSQFLVHWLCVWTLVFVWSFHGIVPKVLHKDADEIRLLQDAGLSSASVDVMLPIVGMLELGLAACVALFHLRRWPFVLTIVLMIASLGAVAWNTPTYLTSAFNPVTLNVQMIVLSAVVMLTQYSLPSARGCIRRRLP